MLQDIQKISVLSYFTIYKHGVRQHIAQQVETGSPLSGPRRSKCLSLIISIPALKRRRASTFVEAWIIGMSVRELVEPLRKGSCSGRPDAWLGREPKFVPCIV